MNPINFEYTTAGSTPEEHNDCAVRALATFLDIPYYQAHDLLKWQGRRNASYTKLFMIMNILETLGIPFARPVNKRITLNQFVKLNSKGVYYCVTRNHAFTLKDSVIFDMFKSGPKTRLIFFAKI